MSDELKPCPFCDGTDINVVIEGNFSFEECAGCGATSEAHRAYEICTEQRKAAAADKWNTRPAEEALQARIAELEAELAAVKEANRWHQVENKMPEIEEMVLVVDVDIVRRGFWQYHGMEVEWRDANNRLIEVYWWHPLPALPWEVEA